MHTLNQKIKTAKQLFKKYGWRGFVKRLQYVYREKREERNYQKWAKLYDSLTDDDRKQIREKIPEFKYQPLISIIMPVYNVEEKWLRLAVESVRAQLYENWELCVADDNSSLPYIKKTLQEYAAKDERIKIVFRETNRHISAASNSALELACGEFTALLDHDDELAETALYRVVEEINNYPETDLIYSDEDKINENGKRFAPNFKPDYSPDLLHSLNLFTHLSVFRTKILRRINGFRIGTEGSQDYDLVLRFIGQIPEENIRHIPHILYHWRAIRGSTALASEEKSYAHARSQEVLQAHFERQGIKATVSKGFAEYHRVNYQLPKKLPKASLITLLDESEEKLKAIEKLIDKTNYNNFEFCLGRSSSKKIDLTRDTKLKIFDSLKNNTASKLNELVKISDGEILIFLDGIFEPQNSDWLKELISLANKPKIGVVGGRLLNHDNTVRNAGVILGLNNSIGFAHQNFPRTGAGNLARLQVTNNFSAVAGMLATRREVFKKLEKFDEINFAEGLFDVDFCLRLKEKNLRVVYTPYAELMQFTDSSTERILKNKNAEEVKSFKEKWKNLLDEDPFYNINFSLKKDSFSISVPPRNMKETN